MVEMVLVADIKKNNDYAMWLKVCCKADCYLLDEYLAQYRRGRIGSVSSHSFFTMIKWHYKLFRYADKRNCCTSVIFTFVNLLFGVFKKIRYVSHEQ